MGSENIGIYEAKRLADGKIEFASVEEPCGAGGCSRVLMAEYELVP
jgi:hypothetical protein